MNYLASGGNYNLNDIEDQTQLIKDTDKFAQMVYSIPRFIWISFPIRITTTRIKYS
jgi:hypothetical protein